MNIRMLISSLRRRTLGRVSGVWVPVVAMAMTGLALSSPVDASTFEVDVSTDSVDANPGDGFCADMAGDCSLRAAVMESNALPGADLVQLAEAVYVLTIGNDCNEGGVNPSDVEYRDQCADLDVTDDLEIRGAGAYRTEIDASAMASQGNSGHLDLAPDTALILEHLMLRGGAQRGSGGAIRNRGGTLEVRDCVLFGNNATFTGGAIDTSDGSTRIERTFMTLNGASAALGGGAIHHRNDAVPDGASLIIVDSSIAGNQAGAGAPDALPPTSDSRGGGISLGTNARTELVQVTLHGNFAYGNGGGIHVSANAIRLDISGSTIAVNRADSDSDAASAIGGNAGGIENQGAATVNVVNTIIAANVDTLDPLNPQLPRPDCRGTIATLRHSLIGVHTSACPVTGTNENNFMNVDPLVTDFGDRGGPVPTLGLDPTSDAIDAADNAQCPSSDARGLFRQINLSCDIGAWESGHQPTFDPKVSIDLVDTSVGDEICAATGPIAGLDYCSLRAAAEEASGLDVANRLIRLDGHTFPFQQVSRGDLDFSTAGTVTLRGAGARVTVIDAGGIDRAIDVDPVGVGAGAVVVLSALTVRGGDAGNELVGGNLRVGGLGTLRLFDVTVEGGIADLGGGIAVVENADAEIFGSTVVGNEARDGGAQGGPGDGGGLHHGSAGETLLARSTVAGNRADRHGGGVAVDSGTVTLDHATVADNVADDDQDGVGDGGGFWQSDDEQVSTSNSIVARNLDAGGQFPDCHGAVDSGGWNVIGVDAACGFGTAGDQTGSLAIPLDPAIESLGAFGGGTDTLRPRFGSPVIDRADPAGCTGTDQIGTPRPQDGDGDAVARCDVGSVELLEGFLFSDGFESGDTLQWSSAIGGT